MTRLAFLVSPSHNRVYAADAPRLAAAELRVLGDRALDGRVSDVAEQTVAGVPYVGFTLDGALSDADTRAIANLSSLYALFETVPGDTDGDAATATRLLRPVLAPRRDVLPSDLLTIQKYAGKTNEDFTRLLLNTTVLATDRPDALGAPADVLTGGPRGERRLRVLDPMCGRGTTLNLALASGWDAIGVDLDTQDVEAYATFLRTWLKTHRYKHAADLSTQRRDGKSLGRRFHAAFGLTREEWAAGRSLEVTVHAADTLRTAELVKPGSVDVVVTDAPYGVQHGTRSRGTGTGRGGRDVLDRSPLALLEQAVPVWSRLLRRGGAVGISWNTRVAPRDALVSLLADAGLEPADDATHRGFAHRVDQSIQRDLVVARKP
ncbi:TRM11 family SAM-dependent methyltransferase [Luteimicrobium subarcticum]|uniref:RNA methylase family UPF0020 n=1 Tax=Luteimicrobium subarcticum TaxID=620910 RepID=A0A2M8WVA0_9MICO|nr:SAM-dependent methyltransferase [Luteimicrobium subarcticum]PJI94849.1 hypothetical protein CLV34_0697 [Luteimicrobium subarcticum]